MRAIEVGDIERINDSSPRHCLFVGPARSGNHDAITADYQAVAHP